MEYRMVAALQRRKLNMFKLREGKFSPRALVWGNPSRAKFAAENRGNIFSLRSRYRGLAKPASSSRTELNWTEHVLSDGPWWLPYRKPCVTKSLGACRQYSQAMVNNVLLLMTGSVCVCVLTSNLCVCVCVCVGGGCSPPMHLLFGAVYKSQGRWGYLDVSNVTSV